MAKASLCPRIAEGINEDAWPPCHPSREAARVFAACQWLYRQLEALPLAEQQDSRVTRPGSPAYHAIVARFRVHADQYTRLVD